MTCLSLGFVEQLLIWLIVVIAVVAVIKLLIPFVDGLTGYAIIGQIISILLWAIVAIMIVYVIFALLGCLLGFGPGIHLPR